jgi:hypothetical protein
MATAVLGGAALFAPVKIFLNRQSQERNGTLAASGSIAPLAPLCP